MNAYEYRQEARRQRLERGAERVDGLDLPEGERHRLRENMRIWDGAPFPAHTLTNLGALIREAKKLAQEFGQLGERASTGPTEATVNGVSIATDQADNRSGSPSPAGSPGMSTTGSACSGFCGRRPAVGFTRKLSGSGRAEGVAPFAGRHVQGRGLMDRFPPHLAPFLAPSGRSSQTHENPVSL